MKSNEHFNKVQNTLIINDQMTGMTKRAKHQ